MVRGSLPEVVVRVVVRRGVLGDLHRDAAEVVHDLLETLERRQRVVVEVAAGQLLDRLDRELGTTEEFRGVDLVLAVPGDVDVRVSRDAKDRGVQRARHDGSHRWRVRRPASGCVPPRSRTRRFRPRRARNPPPP